MKDNKIYNTALYCRLSLDDGSVGESGSIQTQKIILEEYAKMHGFKIFNVYVDDGYSGLNFNRPGFQIMIQDIQGGKINLVITKDLSRKVKAAKKSRNQKGLYTAVQVPYGYKKDPLDNNHLIVDEEIRPVIKLMFRLALEGHGCPKIASILTERNLYFRLL